MLYEVITHLGAISTPQDCGAQEWTSDAWAANVEGTSAVCRMAAVLLLPRLDARAQPVLLRGERTGGRGVVGAGRVSYNFV